MIKLRFKNNEKVVEKIMSSFDWQDLYMTPLFFSSGIYDLFIKCAKRTNVTHECH
jgi:hypothetical protein